MLDYIKANLRYEDGELIRTTKKGNQGIGASAGWVTFCNKKPYKKISLKGKTAYVHHVVFLLHHGYLPKYIDHVDGNSLNNRIENLRAATQSQNIANSRRSIANKSGHKGVSFRKDTQKWQAQIMFNYKHISLGCFESKEAAVEAYQRAAKKFFQNFSRVA